MFKTKNELEQQKKELERLNFIKKLILDNINDIICIIDLPALNFIYVAGACYDILGYTPEEYMQMTIKDVTPPESYQLVKELIDRNSIKYQHGEIHHHKPSLEIQQYRKDGSLVWIEISGTAILNEKNEPIDIVAIVRSIEERKAIELKILEQKTELERQAVKLERQTLRLKRQTVKLANQKKELEKLNAQKNKFFSIIGHDLKNPISSLVYMSSFLIDDYRTNNGTITEDDIIMINSAAKQVQAFLENLLEWSRSSMGTMVYAPARNDVIQIINNCVGFLQVQANVKNISIIVACPTSECYVDCDANMILTVIRNLVSNAIKFSFDNSIEVSVNNYSENSDYVQVSVRDSGVGMSQENIDKLFKIDQKITSTEGTNKETGTGLGLILCKEFIDKHNCKIWVESEIEKGTTFSFTLPKSQSIY